MVDVPLSETGGWRAWARAALTLHGVARNVVGTSAIALGVLLPLLDRSGSGLGCPLIEPGDSMALPGVSGVAWKRPGNLFG